MTSQEQELIDGLVQRIRSTQVTDKDTQAEQYLQQGLAGYPDAVYVLAQTVLVQQYGLQQAQQKIQQLQDANQALQQQIDEAKQHMQSSGGGSFLSHLFGGSSPSQSAPQQPPYQPVANPSYAPQAYPPPPYAQPVYAQPAYAQPVYAQPMGYGSPMGGGGFLRGALQTAAGVAAGEFLVDELFHGFGGGHEYGGGYGGGRPEEIINNNYYGGSGPGEHEHQIADAGSDSSFYNPSNDASRDSDTSAQNFVDPGTGDSDNSLMDSGSATDAGYDDSSSFDDSSSSFDSSDNS